MVRSAEYASDRMNFDLVLSMDINKGPDGRSITSADEFRAAVARLCGCHIAAASNYESALRLKFAGSGRVLVRG